MKIKTICMGFALLLASLPAASADVIFNNWNGNTNMSCAEGYSTCAGSPGFTLTVNTLISTIDTAYATESGGVAPSTVSIYDSSSNLLGSAVSTNAGGFFPGNFQTAAFNLILTTGTYTVSVSDINHWAYNAESGTNGFTAVNGTATPEPSTWGMMLGAGLLGLGGVRRRRKA
jgi:hypothetical protein